MYVLGDYQDVPFRPIDTDEDNIVYWIVNKKTHKNILCGTENELIEKCKSIGEPDKLVSQFLK